MTVPSPWAGPARWGLFEAKLDGDDQQVDVAYEYTGDSSRAGVRRLLEDGGLAGPDRAHARAVLAAWVDQSHPLAFARTVSLELDQPSLPGPALAFVSFEASAGVPPGHERIARIVDAWRSVAHEPVDLSRLRSLPRGAWPLHLASLRPRGSATQRWVFASRRDGVAALLDAEGWPGDASAVQAFIDSTGFPRPYVSVHLDTGEGGLGPEVGVEWLAHGSPRRDQRWWPLFAALIRAGLARTDRLDALCAWTEEPSPTPRIADIKVVFRGDRPVRAKGYRVFGAGHPGA